MKVLHVSLMLRITSGQSFCLLIYSLFLFKDSAEKNCVISVIKSYLSSKKYSKIYQQNKGIFCFEIASIFLKKVILLQREIS